MVFIKNLRNTGKIHVRVRQVSLRADLLTHEELDQVASIVNEAIEKHIEVIMEELPIKDAYESGAIGVFTGKYEDIVKVYTIPGYSKEICGGPHAKNTGELISFKILKEEASSAGVRRIKAVIGGR